MIVLESPSSTMALRNSEYAILKWFADSEPVTGAPGLDLPAPDTAAVAQGYGVPSQRVTGTGDLREALSASIADAWPRLVEVDVAPGMSLF